MAHWGVPDRLVEPVRQIEHSENLAEHVQTMDQMKTTGDD